MAVEALCEVENQLGETDRLRGDAIDLLHRGQANRALEKLSGCFGIWQSAQEAVLKVAQLLRIDLQSTAIWGRPLTDLLGHFTLQLRQIKIALENRDFVALTDILTYEASETSSEWREALKAMRVAIATN
jgi:hypothetical protein